MTTLLEKAKKFSPRLQKKITDEEIALAIAWMQGDVNLGQVAKAMGKQGKSGSGNSLYRIAVALREAHDRGFIRVKRPA